jgi:hypothetical protein
VQSLTCSLASGYLYFTLRHAQTAAVAFDAPPEALALALENLGVVASVGVRALPRAAGGLYLTPRAICSGDAASPAVTLLTFTALGGALGVLGLSAGSRLRATAAALPWQC